MKYDHLFEDFFLKKHYLCFWFFISLIVIKIYIKQIYVSLIDIFLTFLISDTWFFHDYVCCYFY